MQTVSKVKRNIEWQQLMQAPVAKELTDYELIRSVLRYKLTRTPTQNESVIAIFDNADAFQKTTGAVVFNTADQNTIYVDISGPALEYLKTLFEKQNYTGTWREHVKKNDFKLMRCLAKSFYQSCKASLRMQMSDPEEIKKLLAQEIQAINDEHATTIKKFEDNAIALKTGGEEHSPQMMYVESRLLVERGKIQTETADKVGKYHLVLKNLEQQAPNDPSNTQTKTAGGNTRGHSRNLKTEGGGGGSFNEKNGLKKTNEPMINSGVETEGSRGLAIDLSGNEDVVAILKEKKRTGELGNFLRRVKARVKSTII